MNFRDTPQRHLKRAHVGPGFLQGSFAALEVARKFCRFEECLVLPFVLDLP